MGGDSHLVIMRSGGLMNGQTRNATSIKSIKDRLILRLANTLNMFCVDVSVLYIYKKTGVFLVISTAVKERFTLMYGQNFILAFSTSPK